MLYNVKTYCKVKIALDRMGIIKDSSLASLVRLEYLY